METTIRVMIVDDHPVYRDGLRALIHRSRDLALAGEASTAAEAIALVESERPQVVLMDLRLPDMSGIEATRRILDLDPAAGVLILAMAHDDDALFAAMRAGARGYIPKEASGDEIRRAIQSAALGGIIFGAAVAARMRAWFAAPHAAIEPDPFPSLTDREDEVLELIARGRSNAEIGHRLGISDKTVRNHVANVFNKLQVADRAQAIIRAREAGLGRDLDPA